MTPTVLACLALLLCVIVGIAAASLLHHQDRHTRQITEIWQAIGMDQPQQRGRHGA